MRPTVLLPRYRLIADSLREDIRSGALTPGARVPSYRRLMSTHSVTMATVRQAIASLQTEGLITSVPGLGCVVADQQTKWTHIGVPILGYGPEGALYEDVQLLHEELVAEHCDLVMRMTPSVDESSVAELAAWARRRDGIMITGRIPVSAIRAMAGAGAPVMVVGEPLDGECPPGVNTVTADIMGTIQIAISHLVGMGHRRIGLLNGTSTRYYDVVSRCFQECSRAFGLEYGSSGEAQLRLPQHREMRVADACRWYTGLAARPTALLVEGATVATSLIQQFAGLGIRVPEDLSVMAISGGERPPRVVEGLARVESDRRGLLQRAVRILCERIVHRDLPVVREHMLAQWVPGVTCRVVSP